MYKLTIVSGPNRGSSYVLRDGENSIGRLSGNSVTLSSGKVSKRHCVLVVNHGEIVVQDQNSSNGTFVNGVLSKQKKVRPGDRISIGDFVLEVSDPGARSLQAPPSVAGLMNNNVIPFPKTSITSQSDNSLASLNANAGDIPVGPPTDLGGRLLWFFEHQIMPLFYGFNFKYEWRFLSFVLFVVFALINLYFSVGPLMDTGRAAIIREAGKRASFMAREIAERNAPFLAANQETRSEISNVINDAEGVRLALLTDLESRVIAPTSKLNSYLHSGPEALYAVQARDLFRKGRETGLVKEVDSDTIVAIEPVRVVSTAQARNVTVGMAIVSIDTSIATPGMGEVGVVYAETLMLTALVGGVVLLILYFITLKPYQVLTSDLEKALKGDLTQVTREFKVEEMNPLWDLINSALQRIPKTGDAASNSQSQEAPSVEDFLGPLKQVSYLVSFGMAVLDWNKKIAHLNPFFEDLTGIRLDGSMGQELSAVARDQSFAIFMNELLEKAAATPDGVTDDYEFSGTAYKVHASVFGGSTYMGSGPKCYVVFTTKGDA